MKKFLAAIAVSGFLFTAVCHAEDNTPVEQKTNEQIPAPADKTVVPEQVKKEPADATAPVVQGIVNGMGGTVGEAAKTPTIKKKTHAANSAWPEDESKLKLEPADEADKNSSFAEFRSEFLKKLAEKDKAYLLSATDKKLKFITGDYNDFKSFYSLDIDAKRSTVWDDLSKVLKLGGVFTPEGEFCAPYVYCQWPEGVKSNGMAAIIKENTEIKKSPGKSSPTVGTIGYEIVKTSYNSAAMRSGWTPIETHDGRKGFVRNDELRNPEDYRIWFKQKDWKWVMSTILSGGF